MNKHIIKIKLIDDYIKAHNFTKTLFCKICEISMQQLRNLRNFSRVKLTTLTKIADTTNLKLDYIVDKQYVCQRKKPD